MFAATVTPGHNKLLVLIGAKEAEGRGAAGIWQCARLLRD